MTDLTPILIGLIGTLIGAAPSVVVALINRNKTNAEGSSILSAAYVGLVEPQGRVIDRLKKELDEKTTEADDWQNRYNRANGCAQSIYYFCKANGLTPPCRPDGVSDK